MTRRLLLPALALVAALLLSSCSDDGQPLVASPAATVNGETIDADVTVEVTRAVTGASDDALTLGTADAARVLDQQVAVELLRQEAEQRDLEITDDLREEARLATYRQLGTDPSTGAVDPAFGEQQFSTFPESLQELQVESQAVLLALARSLPDDETGAGEVTDELVASIYEERRESDYSQRCWRYVVVDPTTGDEASQLARGEEIAAALRDGEELDAIVEEETSDPTQPAGADVGCLSQGQMAADPPELVAAVFDGPVGEVRDPIAFEGVVVVVEVYDEEVRELADVEDELRAELEAGNDQLRTEAVLALLDRLTADADVDVDARFGRWVGVDAVGAPVGDAADAVRWSVVPPEGPLDPPSSGDDLPIADPFAVPSS